MPQRIAYGALAIAVVFAIAGADALVARETTGRSALLAQGSLIPVVLALIGIAACQELIALFRRMGTTVYAAWTQVACVVLILAPWFSSAGVFGRGPFALAAFPLQIELTAGALLGAGVVAVLRRDIAGGLSSVAATWLVIGYAGLLPGFLTMLRCDAAYLGQHGAWTLLAVILVCKVSDIGAYFSGSLFGRHKLIPTVSPGKSVEGFLGGIAASILLSLIFLKLHRITLGGEGPETHASLTTGYSRLGHDVTAMYAHLSVAQAIVFGIVMSIVGQVGDLVESVFKRSAQAKDSAKILPGFGGILDMIDSPVAVAPVAWFLLTRVWAVL